MLRDVIPFDESPAYSGAGTRTRAIRSFVHFIEKKLGGNFYFDGQRIPYPDIPPHVLKIAEDLREAGIIRGYYPSELPPDEPQVHRWHVPYGAGGPHDVAAGSSLSGRAAALVPALAEALERLLWREADDYFREPIKATWETLGEYALSPYRFEGFSEEQRAKHTRLTLRAGAEYLWIKGYSWTQKSEVAVPAQVMSGKHGSLVLQKKTEPLILYPITTGLATGETRDDALLGGILEIIERDAFMITWLNHLSPPLVNLRTLSAQSADVVHLLELASRYRLDIAIVLLPADAPTHAVCAVVRDAHGGPEVVLGLRAHRQLAKAVEGAILEALRMRVTLRRRNRLILRQEKEKGRLFHLERAEYWARNGRYRALEFLTCGNEATPEAPWERDAPREHLGRLLSWCRDRNYECISVDIGRSARNPTPWHVQMVVMPEMQPLHQDEHLPYLGGTRLREIPALFGYERRKELFVDEPHPFA